jgi:Fe2+ transport system protein FeoA
MKNKKRGAMIVKIRGTRFALGEKIAKNILVTETRQNGE